MVARLSSKHKTVSSSSVASTSVAVSIRSRVRKGATSTLGKKTIALLSFVTWVVALKLAGFLR